MEIRKQQMEALAASQLRRFHAQMLAHLRTFFPMQFVALGEERSLQLVRHGIARGGHYGITAERDVCKLIDLMLTLGPDMDRKFPWIATTLADLSMPARDRVNAVYDALLTSLSKHADAPSP